jgi:hypothetical protein
MMATGAMMPMDVNGDGQSDLVNVNTAGNVGINVFYSNGKGFVPGRSEVKGYSAFGGSIQAAEVNGDSRTDLVWTGLNGSQTAVVTFLSTGTGFSDAAQTSVNVFNASGLPMDYNGDGKTFLPRSSYRARITLWRCLPQAFTRAL